MAELAVMPKYEAYKDSGVDWLGDIPNEWNIVPGFRAYSENKRNNKGMKEDRVLSLSYGKIIVKPKEKLVGLVPESFETYQIVEPGDLIIRCMDLQNDKTSLRTGLSENHGIITSAYLNLKINEKFDSKFLYYYLHSLDTTKVLYKFGTGLRQNLSFQDFYRLPVFDIPKNLQTNIANFLDIKTVQIDEAIAIKEKQIELLKERKQIIIQQAVTQGLDPNAPTKDSGVDWIGEIPEYWDFSKLKYYIEILPGYAFKSELYSTKSTDIRLLRGINVSPSYTKWNEVVYWPENKVKGLEKYFLEEGDLVIAMDRPWVSTGIRVTEIKKDDLPCLLLQRVGRIRGNKNALTAYIKLLLSTNLFLDYFGPMLTGISVPHISSDQIEGFCAPIPPVEEQEKILEYLHIQTEKHDEGISSTQQQIAKLKEYKTTLINSAVTGKIKVPELDSEIN